MQNLITNHLDIWTAAHKTRSTAGRGSNNKLNLHGIKKLRELILELAVRGKLVPQDANDEPASELLKKIAAEKAKLIKEGAIKKEKSLPEITDGEKPFELPMGWEFARFNEVSHLITDGAHHTPKYIDSGIPFLSVKDMSDGKISFDDTRFISVEQHEELSKRCHPQRGDLLLTKIGTTGVPVLIDTDTEFSIFVSVALIKFPITFLSGKFLCLLIKSPFVKSQSEEGTQGVGNKNLVLKTISAFKLAIPPLAEQHRIVAKVDELMAFCDQLEQTQSDTIAAHAQLVEALLATLTNSSDHNELQNNWQRIAAHFDTLFTTEHSIDQLKQTILQLAVMGKLVPQNPNDEPASELLKKIAAEKAQLIKEGKIKKQKPLPEITDEEKPFELPDGWECARLGNLTSRLGSGSTPRGGQSAYVESGIIFLRSQNVWNDGLKLDDTAFISEETHSKMDNTHVFPGDILLNITGASLGRSTIFPEELVTANVSQHVTIIRLIESNMCRFFHLGILSPLVQKLVWGRQVGMAIEGLSKKVLEQFEYPVPPLAEQHRIVTKVDELMFLCDTLKTNLQNAKTTQLALADALVEQAVN